MHPLILQAKLHYHRTRTDYKGLRLLDFGMACS